MLGTFFRFWHNRDRDKFVVVYVVCLLLFTSFGSDKSSCDVKRLVGNTQK